MKYAIPACYLVLLLTACQHEADTKLPIAKKPFFDLKEYFDGEAQRLHSKTRARKIVTKGEKQEERMVDSIDFERELGVFAGSDINRPAWSDKYVVDTMFNDQHEIQRLHVKALDAKLKTRNIEIDFTGGKVSKIEIENNSLNAIASSNQVLVYQPTFGYSIESRQKVALADDQFFKVEVLFLY